MFTRLPLIGEWCDPFVIRALSVDQLDVDGANQWCLIALIANETPDHCVLEPLYVHPCESREAAIECRDQVGTFIADHLELEQAQRDGDENTVYFTPDVDEEMPN